jgi:GNAT superfamily N-acetyltransferase
MISIEPVETSRQRRQFVRLPRDVYPAGSPWVRPLDSILLDLLDVRRNPFFQGGLVQAFIVRSGTQPIGRILAHVWRRHHRLHNERAGYFGFFECIDDQSAASALLDAAANFARNAGCDVLRGPFNMTAAQEMGIMTEGFDQIPAIDMVYTPSHYPNLLSNAGLMPCLEMDTWRNQDIARVDPQTLLQSRHRELAENAGVTIRTLYARRRTADMELIRELVNSSFLGNWSFVPITREEWALQVGALIPLLDPHLIVLAEVQGVPVGVTFAAPDFNRVLQCMNGSLWHPNVLALLRRPPTKHAVVILFAVRKHYQNLGISRLLNATLIQSLHRRGYRSLAITWIASNNHASRAQAEALGMQRIHRLAMYERRL